MPTAYPAWPGAKVGKRTHVHLAVRHGPERALLRTSLPSITELSPRKRLEERDIIISSFGLDCYRPGHAGNSASGAIYEALFLSWPHDTVITLPFTARITAF